MSTFATDFPRKLTLPTVLLLALASSPAHSDSVSNDPVEVLRCWTTPATGQPVPACSPQVATSIIDLPLFAGARPAQAGSPADKAPAPVTSTGAAGKTSVEATVGKPVTTTLASGGTTSPTTGNTTKSFVEPTVAKPVTTIFAPGGTTSSTTGNTTKSFVGATVGKPVINSLAPAGGTKVGGGAGPKTFFVNHKGGIGHANTRGPAVNPTRFEATATIGKSLRWAPSDTGASRFGSKQEAYQSGAKRH